MTLPDLPAGPPLGLGGLPFESAELELTEGSLLALYTDGLLEVHRRDLDEGLALLRGALEQPACRLEDRCKAAVEALLPVHPQDDVALLLARTRALPPESVATWELPAEPTAAAEARELTSATLTEWGQEELAFTAELVVSELVTNAYRYGGTPITLRLIRDRTLICEVSDPNSTAPTSDAPSAPTRAAAASSWSPNSRTAGAPATPARARRCGRSCRWRWAGRVGEVGSQFVERWSNAVLLPPFYLPSWKVIGILAMTTWR